MAVRTGLAVEQVEAGHGFIALGGRRLGHDLSGQVDAALGQITVDQRRELGPDLVGADQCPVADVDFWDVCALGRNLELPLQRHHLLEYGGVSDLTIADLELVAVLGDEGRKELGLELLAVRAILRVEVEQSHYGALTAGCGCNRVEGEQR